MYVYMHLLFCTYPIAILQRGVDSLVSYHMLLKENSKELIENAGDLLSAMMSISLTEYLVHSCPFICYKGLKSFQTYLKIEQSQTVR